MADKETKPVRHAVIKRLTTVSKADPNDPYKSKQIGKDPFDKQAYERGLQQPPFPLEQLVWLAEMHPAHSACISQRATDVVGGGWHWEPKHPEEQGDQIEHNLPASRPSESDPMRRTPNASRTREREEQRVAAAVTPPPVTPPVKEPQQSGTEERDRVEEAFKELAGERQTMVELFHQLWSDYVTHATAYLEVVRDPQGKVRRLYHVPTHTVRAHKDGVRFCQQRATKKVWFVEWNSGVKIDWSTGEQLPDDDNGDNVASELLVFRKTARRSDFYGIPDYVSSIGWIMLAIEARDYNIKFFKNNREARWVVILSNLEPEDDTFEQTKDTFENDLKDPHRTVVMEFEGEAKVHMEKMTEDLNDASFGKLLELCDDAVFLSHKVPRDRVGMVKTGPLGGNVADQANRTYREGVVIPDQEILNHRMQVFCAKELDAIDWLFHVNDLDSKAQRSDLDGAMKGFRAGILTVNEARDHVGMPPIKGPAGDMFIWEMEELAARSIKSRSPETTDEDIEALVSQAVDKAIANNLSEVDRRFALIEGGQ